MRALHLTLTSAWLAVLLGASAAVHAAGDRIDQQVPADAHGIVEISSFSGKVEVSGWDQLQVSVHGDISGGADKVDVSSDHGRTTITVRSPHFSFFGGGVNLKIKVPRGSEVDATVVSADVSSTGVTGAQRLKSVSGEIKADVAQADVEVKTVSGDVVLHGDGKPAELHVTTISGDLQLDHGAGDMEANSTSGDMNIQLDPGRSVRMHTISGDIAFHGRLTKDADLDTQTVSGDVKLHAAAEGGYEYEVTTFSGDINNCFNVEAERTSRHGPGQRLSGSRGDRSGHVRIKTMSGDVNLCDKP
jgi:DUF4097 and DUF4098 domain-containing protein YvlB